MTRPSTKPAPTIEKLAETLGVSRRTMLRHKGRGMPTPKPGERLSTWRRRAVKWQADHVARPGGRATAGSEQAKLDWRRARAERAEWRLAKDVAQVHATPECVTATADRVSLIVAAFDGVPAALAAEVPALRNRYDVRARIEDIVHAAHQALWNRIDSESAEALSPATARAASPEPDPGLPLKTQSDYWLGIWQGARAEAEQRTLARERGDVHDVVECEQAECSRIATYVAQLVQLPDRLGSVLLHLSGASVRKRTTADLRRLAGILRGDVDLLGPEPEDDEDIVADQPNEAPAAEADPVATP
ncbi:MAG: hypothetical protein ABIP94_25110 [Planctomycetota bacterium]